MFSNLIFTGKVRHRRFTPKRHHFSYQLFMFCFEITDIAQSLLLLPKVAIEKFHWFTFYRKNYLDETKVPLHIVAREMVAKKFNVYPTGKIYLLTHLTCLGYCFNPISFYFILDTTNTKLAYLILEVTNTPWGERFHYILESHACARDNVYQFCFKKNLHVSPFMAMDYEYVVNLKLTATKIIVHMENRRNGVKDFDATLQLKGEKVITYSLITYKIIAAIYWQALKLWIKRLPFYSHPNKN